jgi:ADP-ribosylglycohydrolase
MSTEVAVGVLGNGSRITAPFALWCAARHIVDYDEVLWATASAGGDNDTNGAIGGRIVALANGTGAIPEDWLMAREALKTWEKDASSTNNPVD